MLVRLKKVYLTVLIIPCFHYCSNNKMNLFNTKNILNDSLISQWRSDSLGCMNVRSFILFEKIYSKYRFDTMGKQSIIYLLGRPNFTYSNENVEGLNYYMDSYCKQNKIDSTKNKCWLSVLILEKQHGNNYIKSCDSE